MRSCFVFFPISGWSQEANFVLKSLNQDKPGRLLFPDMMRMSRKSAAIAQNQYINYLGQVV